MKWDKVVLNTGWCGWGRRRRSGGGGLMVGCGSFRIRSLLGITGLFNRALLACGRGSAHTMAATEGVGLPEEEMTYAEPCSNLSICLYISLPLCFSLSLSLSFSFPFSLSRSLARSLSLSHARSLFLIPSFPLSLSSSLASAGRGDDMRRTLL